jgi:hypothetical protein
LCDMEFNSDANLTAVRVSPPSFMSCVRKSKGKRE